MIKPIGQTVASHWYIEPASSFINTDIVALIEKTPFVLGYMQGALEFEGTNPEEHKTITSVEQIPVDCLWEAYRDCQEFTSNHKALIAATFAKSEVTMQTVVQSGRDFFFCRSFDQDFVSEPSMYHSALKRAAQAMNTRFLGRTIDNESIHFVGQRFKKGDIVTVRPEFQDAGDDSFTWIINSECILPQFTRCAPVKLECCLSNPARRRSRR
jgi:hypothetical protein